MTDQNLTPNPDENVPADAAESAEAPAIDFGAEAPAAEAPAIDFGAEAPAAAEEAAAAGVPETAGYDASAAPTYGAPDVAAAASEAPAYGAAETPAAPATGAADAAAYGAPAAPTYGAPDAAAYGAAGYAAGQPGAAYGAPAGYPTSTGYPQNGAARPDELSELTLNLWLSVFFQWLPALIFFLIRKDTATPLIRKAYVDNLNYQIVATIATYAAAALIWLIIPALVPLAVFVIAIIHAATVPGQIRAGQVGKFYLAPSWVK